MNDQGPLGPDYGCPPPASGESNVYNKVRKKRVVTEERMMNEVRKVRKTTGERMVREWVTTHHQSDPAPPVDPVWDPSHPSTALETKGGRFKACPAAMDNCF